MVSGIADRIVARAAEVGVAHAVHSAIETWGVPDTSGLLDSAIRAAETRLGIVAVPLWGE